MSEAAPPRAAGGDERLAAGSPSASRPPAARLLPREHGAYGQLAVSLLTGLLLAKGGAWAVLLAAAAVAAFFAHEPLVVLLGHRGARLRALAGRRAGMALALLGAASLAGCAAAALAGAAHLGWLALSFALSAAAALVAALGVEKTTGGEALAALALTSWVGPVATAGGASSDRAALLAWAVCAAHFCFATCSVRSVIAAGKPGGAGPLRAVALIAPVAGLALLAALAFRGLVPARAVAALAPGAALSFALALTLPPPRHLKRIGWTLAAASMPLLSLGL